MRKLIALFGLLVLFSVVVAACGTAPTPSPAEVALQQTQQALVVCATAVSLGMQNPCVSPTPMPTSTPTPLPTPTATPVTGWKQFTDDGKYIKDMPAGFVPDCGGVVGCPGYMYIQYVNGFPVGNPPTGTPSYWPYLLVGTPVLIVVLALLFFSAYGMAAPQRAIAKATLLMAEAYAKSMNQIQSAPQLGTSGVPNQGIPEEFIRGCLEGFSEQQNVPRDFRHTVLGQLREYRRGDFIPLTTIQQVLLGYDKEHETQLARPFGEYISAHAQELPGE